MAKKKSKWKKRIIILVIILIIVGIYLYINKNAQNAMAEYAKSAIKEETALITSIEVKTTGNGVIEPNKRFDVYSTYVGKVKEQYVNLGDFIEEKDKLFKIGDYNIKAPIDGIVLSTNISEGDYLDANVIAKSPILTLADMSKVKFTLQVDELEIGKVKLDMEVKITADAVPDKEYVGKVSKIDLEGKNTNGISTYDVTVEIEDYEGLKVGMNVDSNLILEKKENVLAIPMTAINRVNGETYVYIKDMEYSGEKPVFYVTPESMAEIPGYKKQAVVTGTNNKDYIEITSGLNENDKVYYISNTKTLTEYMLEQSGTGGSGMYVMGEEI